MQRKVKQLFSSVWGCFQSTQRAPGGEGSGELSLFQLAASNPGYGHGHQVQIVRPMCDRWWAGNMPHGPSPSRHSLYPSTPLPRPFTICYHHSLPTSLHPEGQMLRISSQPRVLLQEASCMTGASESVVSTPFVFI